MEMDIIELASEYVGSVNSDAVTIGGTKYEKHELVFSDFKVDATVKEDVRLIVSMSPFLIVPHHYYRYKSVHELRYMLDCMKDILAKFTITKG